MTLQHQPDEITVCDFIRANMNVLPSIESTETIRAASPQHMTTTVQQEQTAARRSRRRSPSTSARSPCGGSSRKRSPTQQYRNMNDTTTADISSNRTWHGSSKFENSASEQEMRSILSEAFCKDDELTLEKLQAEIDRLQQEISDNSAQDLNASFAQSIPSIKSAPASNQSSGSEFQYSFEDGYTFKKSPKRDVIRSSFHFPELDWGQAVTLGDETTESNLSSDPKITQQTDLQASHGANDIFSSKLPEALSTSEHIGRLDVEASSHRSKRTQDNRTRQRAKSLSHLPAIAERRRPAKASTATAVSSPATFQTTKVKPFKQHAKVKKSVTRKEKTEAVSKSHKSDNVQGEHHDREKRMQRHHQHRHSRQHSHSSSSSRPSPSPSMRRKKAVVMDALKSELKIQLESEATHKSVVRKPKSSNSRDAHSPHRRRSSPNSRQGSPAPSSGRSTRKRLVALARPHTEGKRETVQPETGNELMHQHPSSEARTEVLIVPEAAPANKGHQSVSYKQRRASTGTATIISSDLLESSAIATEEALARRRSLGKLPSHDFHLDSILTSRHMSDHSTSSRPVQQLAESERPGVTQTSLHSEASRGSHRSLNTMSSKSSKFGSKFLSSFNNSPSTERRMFRRRASAHAAISTADQEPMAVEETSKLLQQRQPRRMSDGGFSRAYGGIKNAVGPIVSPRKNAKRASKIIKGVGHGIGMALQSSSSKKGNIAFDKSSPNPATMKELAHVIGITDEQIRELQNHGLTIADMALTKGLS